MNDNETRIREAFLRIAEIANAAAYGRDDSDDSYDDDGATGTRKGEAPSCSVKALPKRLILKAAQTAMGINPVNAPLMPLSAMGIGAPSDPLSMAVVTGKYWGPTPRKLTVSFMDSTPANLRARIVGHLNAWTKTGCISFVETQGTGQVRISLGSGGYWSYLGTDVLLIPRNRPTMNLQGFTMNTSENEYKRVIRHEAGHTLGAPHEHMRKELVARIDRQKAYDYFRRTQGWTKQDVDQQVLTPLDDRTILGTPADQTSIMCYQLPGSITRDGRPVLGGLDINQSDYEFVARIYPKPGQGLRTGQGLRHGHAEQSDHVDEWDSSEDIEEVEA
jgi:hypothetical protein